MSTFNIEQFEQNIQATRVALREGVLSINVWNAGTGLTLAEWQGNETAVALLTQLISELSNSLVDTLGSGFGTKDYLYLNLKDDKALVVINHGNDLMQGWLIDSAKTQTGILLGMAVPNAIANISSTQS